MDKIIVLFNLLRNYRKFTKNFTIKFYLFINPIYCWFCYFLIKLLLIIKGFRIINFLCTKNFLQAGIRYISQKDRLTISQKINYYNKDLNILKTTYKSDVLAELKKNGFSKIGKIFTEKDCDEFKNTLHGSECFNSQTLIQSNGKSIRFEKNFFEQKVNYSYLYFKPNISLKLKKLSDFLKDKDLNNLIKNYLNFEPYIYNLTTWVNFQSQKKHYVHRVHRDHDDFKFMTLIIYWTDVDNENGATQLIKKSHLLNGNSYNLEDEITLDGTKGNVYLFDGTSLHRGNEKISRYRITTWVRFGKRENYASVIDGGVSDPYYYSN